MQAANIPETFNVPETFNLTEVIVHSAAPAEETYHDEQPIPNHPNAVIKTLLNMLYFIRYRNMFFYDECV